MIGMMRGRWVLALAVLAVGGALWSGRQTGRGVPEDLPGGPLLGELPLDRVREVRLAKGDQTVTLRRNEGGWGVEERGGYPADPEKLRRLVFSLSGLEASDRLTDDPAKYDRMGVGELPEGGRLELLGGEGEPLAQVVLGRRRTTGTATPVPGDSGQFVRVGEDPRVYAVGRSTTVEFEPTQWLVRELLAVPEADVRRIEVQPGVAGQGFELRREAAGDPLRLIGGIPEGRTLRAGAEAGVARAVANLTLQDAFPQDSTAVEGLEFGASYRVSTADGLAYVLVAAERDGRAFARLSAETWEAPVPAEAAETEEAAATAPEDPSQRAAAWNRRHAGWVYEIPKYVFNNLVQTRDSLLEKPATE